ncbi:MAG TPA: NAD-dependent epimerase/dehydratase family protein [Deltaproteobacteria bacterium]|nr:NAD-dependent epimerase/dehydratase family protein [Deltaproteobacteria bacterium]
MLQGMRVGVTGATGFLGTHIARELLDRGADVVGIVRSLERGAELEARGVTLRRADLMDPEALVAAAEGLDALVSNASPAVGGSDGDPQALISADRRATQNVVSASLAAGVPRFVHISSVAVYRMRLPWRSVREDHPRRTAAGRRWPRRWLDLGALVTRPGYADSKAVSEEIVWAATAQGLRPTVLRPGPVYGSRDTKLLGRYLAAMEQRIRVVPGIGLPHVHAGDVAAAVVGALVNEQSIGRAYNVTDAPRSLLSVARTVRAIRGHGPVLIGIPLPLWIAWDNSAAQRDLGVRYRSLDDGMREALAP